MDLKNSAAVPAVVLHSVSLFDAVKQKYVPDTEWIVLHHHTPKFSLKISSSGSSVAVDCDGFICLPDILQ